MITERSFHKQMPPKVSFSFKGTQPSPQCSPTKKEEQQAVKLVNSSPGKQRYAQLQINFPQPTNNNHNSHALISRKQPWQPHLANAKKGQLGLKMKTELQQLSPTRPFSRQNSSNEVNLLKEEIRFMRKKLVEAENAEKDIRLQFQLYKANVEQNEQNLFKPITSIHFIGQEPKETKFKEHQKEREIDQLKMELRRSYQKNQQFESRLEQFSREKELKDRYSQQQLQSKDEQIHYLINTVKQSEELLRKKLQQQIEFQEVSKKEQTSLSNRLQKNLLQQQQLEKELKQSKISHHQLQVLLQQQVVENTSLHNKVEDLQQWLDAKNKDVQFLNQQAGQLDSSLFNAIKDIENLKSIIEEQSRASSQDEVGNLRAKLVSFQQKISLLEAEIERLALCIYELRTAQENHLHSISDEGSTLQIFKLKCQELESLKKSLQDKYLEELSKKSDNIRHLQREIQRLKAQNEEFKESVEKFQSNQRVLMNELQYIRNQRDRNAQALQVSFKKQERQYLSQIDTLKEEKQLMRQHQIYEIRSLQQKLSNITQKFNDATLKYQSNLDGVILKYEQQIKHTEGDEELLLNSNSSLAEGRTLSKKQLKNILHQIKSQPDVTQTSEVELKEQVQILREQLQIIKSNYEKSLNQLKQKYERQIEENQEEYSQQLNIYTGEIEKLVEEMNSLKKQEQIINNGGVEVIHEEPEEQNYDSDQKEADNDAVRRDLIMHVQDPSDFYVSPPSSTPIKKISPSTTSNQSSENKSQANYMLQDIIDLESKIHNYIKNFNKKRVHQSESQ